ncbi:MMS19 nucleotide excision repair protein homolog [Sitophilus oryzae]|uniref:MMS19 nucleotide excision repair protein n=1 Tax=Sitophilus oryzae TaxID=7048 RepID=A0A6J2YQA4_SITOR|nr:MMS19 nucleotide excision repair protein homolog [Sitophilus oryzae]
MESNNCSYLNSERLEILDKEDNKHVDIAVNITKDIAEKKISILDVVEKLGYLLVNASFTKREIGVLILSETVQKIDSKALNPEQLSFLCSYFSEKLKDHHQVATSALKGVYALINIQHIPNESVVHLLTTLFNHITCQQQQQPDRYLIYEIYETVLNKHINVVESMGIDFVYGVISSIDGERDPKNLIYLFKWLQVFLKKVKLAHLSEEMFDVLACYFPVDFKAPPSDKNKITREDLAESLAKCLTAIPEFGTLAIPLALEKLDSALKIAKNDSLNLLVDGCKNFDAETYSNFSLEIYNQLQKDIFSTPDEEIRQKYLACVKEVVRKLGTQSDQNKFNITLSDITLSLKQNLLPDSKMFVQTSQILLSVAQANKTSAIYVAKIVCGFLGTSYQITANSSQKIQQLRVYIDFLKTAVQNNQDFDLNSIEEISNAPALFLQAILQDDANLVVEGFKGFIQTAKFLNDSVRNVLFENLKKLIVLNHSEPLKSVINECLAKMAENFHKEVENKILYNEIIEDVVKVDSYIGSLCCLVKVPYFENYVIDTVIRYSVQNLDCSKVVLRHLSFYLGQNSRFIGLLLGKKFISNLTEFLQNIPASDSIDTEYLLNIRNVLVELLKKQDASVQKDIYVHEVKKNYQNQITLLTVLSGLITPFKKSLFDDFSKTDFLLNCCLNSFDYFVQDTATETLANILNKITEEHFLQNELQKIEQICEGCEEINKKVKLTSWVVKGLVTRNHQTAWTWTDKLINLLNQNANTAIGFRIVMDEVHSSLTRENNCNIMPLYKQKFYIYVTNKICTINGHDQASYYNTIGYLIEHAPRQAVIGQFKKVLKLTFLCLENSRDPEVLEILILRITDFVVSKETVIEDNLEDILLRLLNLTTFEHSMKVRIAAIKAIRGFTNNYPIYKLVPFQQKVIRALGQCIDDRKRIVRKEATECRSLWFLLDAPL